MAQKISIIGTVGLPANYGGFETLVENLVSYHHAQQLQEHLTVYCSSKNRQEHMEYFLSAHLAYIPLNANGVQSILYDIISLFSAILRKQDTILLLGVSGAIALPLVRWFSSAKIITNIDGIEWKREKWRGLAKNFLKLSEKMAIKYSNEVIADNDSIADYVTQNYDITPHVIAYGGDHAVQVEASKIPFKLPESGYGFAVCRIEPENNVHMILDAFSKIPEQSLIFVGNWQSSEYGKSLKDKYTEYNHIHLINPIYDLGLLKSLRSHAGFYLHGHSAGGTNPSLVEAMHFGIPVLAYNCNFNKCTTENQAAYFHSSEELVNLILMESAEKMKKNALAMRAIAERRYTWDVIAKKYFHLIQQ